MSWDADADPIYPRPRPQPLPPIIALTGCCPVLRRQEDLTPTQWQQEWANLTYRTWITATAGLPPGRWAAMLNFSDVPFSPPSPETIILTDVPANGHWPALDCFWGLWVLNHVQSPRRFLREVGKTIQPAGLLALSFAYWNSEGEDCTNGAATRRRIYNPASLQALIKEDATPCGLRPFGGVDWRYRGDACGEYTIGTLVLQKQQE